MRKVVLIFLVIAFSVGGESLTCNHCIGRGCVNKAEACKNVYDVCANVFYLPPIKPDYFRRCMKEADCRILQSQPQLMTVTCCQTDLCN